MTDCELGEQKCGCLPGDGGRFVGDGGRFVGGGGRFAGGGGRFAGDGATARLRRACSGGGWMRAFVIPAA